MRVLLQDAVKHANKSGHEPWYMGTAKLGEKKLRVVQHLA